MFYNFRSVNPPLSAENGFDSSKKHVLHTLSQASVWVGGTNFAVGVVGYNCKFAN